jgi:cytochrome c oxidase cbb3-type subunit III
MNIRNITLGALALLTNAFGTMAQAEAQTPTPEAAYFGIPDKYLIWILAMMAVFLTIVVVLINDSIKNLARTHDLWKNRSMGKVGMIIMLLSYGSTAGAADGTTASADNNVFWMLICANAFLIVYAFYQMSVLRKLTKFLRGEEEAAAPAYVETESWISVAWRKINGLRKQEQEADIMMDHEYDGIKELDNVLPPWWKYGFYVCIVWSAIYLVHFHITKTGALQIEEYETSVKKANEEVAAYLASRALNVDEYTVELVLDDSRLKAGRKVYMDYCRQCHGDNGEGGVGPCFTDNYWIHGGTINDLFKTIKYGVPQKGMVPWESQLTAIEIQNVATYIITLEGKGDCSKEPQGVPYDRAASGAASEGDQDAASEAPANGTDEPADEG